jgi:hypothetical protein
VSSIPPPIWDRVKCPFRKQNGLLVDDIRSPWCRSLTLAAPSAFPALSLPGHPPPPIPRALEPVGWPLSADQLKRLDEVSGEMAPYPYYPYRIQEGFARLNPPSV